VKRRGAEKENQHNKRGKKEEEGPRKKNFHKEKREELVPK